jgi:hypothetical protein
MHGCSDEDGLDEGTSDADGLGTMDAEGKSDSLRDGCPAHPASNRMMPI